MAQNFFQTLAKLVALTLVLANLPSQLMPLAFSLLQFSLGRLFVPLYSLVLLKQSIYFGFELFQIIKFHRSIMKEF